MTAILFFLQLFRLPGPILTNWVRLKFAAMNLKKFAIRKWEDTHILLQILIFPLFFVQNRFKTPVLPDTKLGFLDGLKAARKGQLFCYSGTN